MKTLTTIGCCDSGIGGMITVDALHKQYPNLNIVYIADQKNAPYGLKTAEQIQGYAHHFLTKFQEMGIEEVVVACNTLCCNGLEEILSSYPKLNVHTIIQPTCKQLENKTYKTVNILATPMTIKSHVYKQTVQEILPNAFITEIAAEKFVPIIENGCNENELIKAIQEVCSFDAQAWILGCTHYPLIRPYIKDKGDIFDSIQPVIEMFKEDEIIGEGKVLVYTTGNVEKMKQSIHQLLDTEYEVKSIVLE